MVLSDEYEIGLGIVIIKGVAFGTDVILMGLFGGDPGRIGGNVNDRNIFKRNRWNRSLFKQNFFVLGNERLFSTKDSWLVRININDKLHHSPGTHRHSTSSF